MPTIDSLPIIKDMLKNDGRYPEDPQAFAISSYRNDWGNTTYHIAFNDLEWKSLQISPYCHDIRLLWSRYNGLTAEGKAFLDD